MHRRGGFTLIEAIAAVVVIGIAIPPMLWALSVSHAHRASQVLASRARWLAVEKIEDIIADRHSGSRGYPYVVQANYPAEPAVPGFEQFARSVSIQETGPDLASAGAGYKVVVCTVSYTDPTGRPVSLPISTVLTEYDS